MYRNLTHPKSVRRGVGVAVLTGAAAGLIGLAGPGSASASPDVAYVPSLPSNVLDAVALNPQPLPPRLDLSRVALNPQPLPPGPDLSPVALNPQPLPPAPDLTRVLLPRLGF